MIPTLRLHSLARFAGLAAVCLGPILLRAEETQIPAAGRVVAPARWKDIEGREFSPLAPSMKATVFVFASIECPISNLYMPRVSELARDFKERGVRFFLIDANREDSAGALRRYASERSLPFPVVKDDGKILADWLAASRTPEAMLVDSAGDIRYRGRIDDSQDRAKVVHSDLREALDAVLTGKPVVRPRTIAFGCAIFRDARPAAPAHGDIKVTFSRDIAPILNKNCVVCHRAGETAPFALQTYQQARTWAAVIKDYTARRIMPPWKAVPGCGDFFDARTLSDGEIARIARWADSGAPLGNPKDMPTTPRFPDPTSWSLGKPDVVIEPVRPYHLAAEGPDVYRNFVLPIDFKEDRYVSAIEFKPGNRAVVHHVVLYIDLSGKSAQLDGKETEPGYTVPGTGIGVVFVDWGEVWVPGRTPRFLPAGVAVKIPKGAKLVMQVHYHKNGAPQTDTTQAALYFAKERVEKVMHTLPLTNANIALQPGGNRQQLKFGFTLPFDAHLHTIFPHMHLLGREMKITATLPDGDKKPLPLIYVNDWDFNWQETYAYRQSVALPKGTRIEMEAIYDNSESNPRQTSHPPKMVRWGEQTTDEMCVCVLGFTVDQEKLDIKPDALHGGI